MNIVTWINDNGILVGLIGTIVGFTVQRILALKPYEAHLTIKLNDNFDFIIHNAGPGTAADIQIEAAGVKSKDSYHIPGSTQFHTLENTKKVYMQYGPVEIQPHQDGIMPLIPDISENWPIYLAWNTTHNNKRKSAWIFQDYPFTKRLSRIGPLKRFKYFFMWWFCSWFAKPIKAYHTRGMKKEVAEQAGTKEI